jgi:hypothetical protein
MNHSSVEMLKQKCEYLAAEITIGQLYFHYRNPQVFYKVLALGLQEATEKPCVIYQNVDNQLIWVRNVDDWSALVEYQGRQVPRFQKV